MRVVVFSPFAAERSALEQLLREEGHEVCTAATRLEGLALAAVSRAEAVIADAQLPGLDGAALIRELARRGPPPRTILLCSRSAPCRSLPGVVCLTKPIDLPALYQHLAKASGPHARAG